MHLMKRKWARIAALPLVVAALLLGLGAQPAAAKVPCHDTYHCLWIDTQADGLRDQWDEPSTELGGHPFNNEGSSAEAQGTSCWHSNFYNNSNQLTSGKHFVLYSYNLAFKNYRDYNLTNGAGLAKDNFPYHNNNSPGNSVSDIVSFLQFSHCR